VVDSPRVVSDDGTIVASKAVGPNEGVSAFPSDIRSNRLEACEVCSVEGTGHFSKMRYKSFHEERDTGCVHFLAYYGSDQRPGRRGA
jgi:hypothetical protein